MTPLRESLNDGCAKSRDCGFKLSVVAVNKSEKLVWKSEIYRGMYDDRLETDVQIIEPRSWKLKRGGKIVLIDERAREYVVDAKSGHLLSPADPFVYLPPGVPGKNPAGLTH